MRAWRTLTIAVLGAALLAGGCGGGSSADQQAVDRSIAALEDRLRQAGLREAADEDDDDLEFTSEECRELDAALAAGDDLPGEEASGETTFELETDVGGQMVAGFAGLVDDGDRLEELFDLLADERLPMCIQEALVSGIGKEVGAEAGAVQLTGAEAVPVQSDVGDRSVGVRVAGDVQVAGLAVPLVLELEVARLGRGAAGVVLMTFGDGLPAIERGEALQVLLDELEPRATAPA